MTSAETRALLPAAVWFVPAIMLLVALGDMPYGYYTLLRWIICGAFLLLLVQEHRLAGGVSVWLVLFAPLAILFNPLAPVHMTREAWAPIDAGSALLLVVHYAVRTRSARAARRTSVSGASATDIQQPAKAPREQHPVAAAQVASAPYKQEPDSNALAAGSRLQEYEIVRVLGAGGFGITYLAFDHNLKNPVAIKEYFYAGLATRTSAGAVVPSSTRNDDGFQWGRDRFLDEAQVLSRFDHPNIVRVHRYFKANNTAYIVMEYVEGASLAAVLEKHGTLTPDQWRPWMEALLDGLEHVHSQNYLHRDIKPANIVIRADPAGGSSPVLVDFGAARRAAADKTRHLTAVHTPGYAPIEQYSTANRQGPATDIYALAAVSYRALAGEPPPDAADRMIEDECQPLVRRLRCPDDSFLAAIDRALAPRAPDRPQSIAGWRAQLTGRAYRAPYPSGASHVASSIVEPDETPNGVLEEPVNYAQWEAAQPSVSAYDDDPDQLPTLSSDSDEHAGEDMDWPEEEWEDGIEEEELSMADAAPEGLGPGEDEDGRW